MNGQPDWANVPKHLTVNADPEAGALTEDEQEALISSASGPWITDDWSALLAVIERIVRQREAAAWDECHRMLCVPGFVVCCVHVNPYRSADR